ncbi:MAG TPA: ATP-binding cassette domain-containing protein, partial [bacterium]|nr:ATP-binding cassette domain-containing protein [bacterium]
MEAIDVVVRFGDLAAVDRVSLAAAPGEVLAVVGENGAGKTTLMNVLFGLVRPSAGEVRVGGRRVAFRSARDAIAAGIGMVHQHFRLVRTLTVAENLVLGDEPARGALLDARAAEERTAALAADLGFRIDPRARVEDLPVGAQQRVEILKSLARGANVLILDEPTAVLTPQESDDLFRVVRTLAAKGKTVLFISHKLGEVAAASTRV